jgi:glyoxylase-like metal-dependent hydrolase (beta-lactamase superfamily II)
MRLTRILLSHSTIMGLMIMQANAGKLNYTIYRADANSFHVASVLVSGEKEAILVDAQFTLADAHKVAAEVLKSGKNLTAIYVSHGDPDYYFGLGVLKQAFPEAHIYATPQTLAHMRKTYQKKLEVWGPKLGKNGPKDVVFPEALAGNFLPLEGKTLEIKGLDGPSPERSYVWIPDLKAIVGGVNVYDGLHLWTADAGTPEKRKAWLAILEGMEKLRPEIVVPGHALGDDHRNAQAIAYSKQYLLAFEKESDKAKDSGTLIAAMGKLYPDAQLAIALQLGAKVAKGEMSW